MKQEIKGSASNVKRMNKKQKLYLFTMVVAMISTDILISMTSTVLVMIGYLLLVVVLIALILFIKETNEKK